MDHRALFEHACDGMIVLDASLCIVTSNAAFSAMVGVPSAELVGRPIVTLLHPDELRANPIETNAVVQDGVGMRVRRFLSPNGAPLETEIASTQIADDQMFCVVRRTARPLAEHVVRDTEARFRAVAENLHAGIVVTDLENRTLYVNEYMCERTGYAREELLGRLIAPLFLSAADQAEDAQRLERRRSGVREVYEVAHRRKNGTSFLGEVSAAPLHDGEGRMIGTVAVVIDVTERYEWEREMAEREHRYRLLFEVMPMPAWVYDVESCDFLAVNPAAVEHYGYSADQFLAMTILDIRPPEDVPRAMAAVRARRAGYEGKSDNSDWGKRHCKADGTVIDVEILSHAFDFEGRRARVVVVNDISEQRRMRLREREVEAHLLQAQKMDAVGRLAGGVAHDFNNLLSVILNAASAIEVDLPASSPLREDIGDIRQAVERGAALTRQLLAFGRKEVHAPSLIDVHEIVTNVERLLARALGGQVRLEARRGAEPAQAVADASQIEQVLVNLAINARDAMPSGGTLTITTAVVEIGAAEAESLGVATGRYASIEVADTGIGMDEATRMRAFEPFFTTKGPHEGTGLGLATVYGIVRQSAGAVRISSVPGQGTQVTVLLPQQGGAPIGSATAAVPTPRSVAAVQSSERVLLVEDEPQVRGQAKRLLERCDFVVIEATDGVDGERQFQANGGAVDVIVTDVVMPRMGGVEMVARIRAQTPAIPVVFVSGFTAEDRDLALDSRTAFVAKPYTLATLRNAIASVVAG